MPSSLAPSPSAQNTARHGTAHENLTLPPSGLYSLHFARCALSCEGWRSPPARQCSTLHEIQPAIPCRAELMRPSCTKKTDRLTHSSAPVCRRNDPHAGPKASKLILPRIRGLDVAESRGQKAPDLPALCRLPVPSMYPTAPPPIEISCGDLQFLLLRPSHFGPGMGFLIPPSLY